MKFINPDFPNLMAEAARLTQSGDLQGATATIQAAFTEAATTVVNDLGLMVHEAQDIKEVQETQNSTKSEEIGEVERLEEADDLENLEDEPEAEDQQIIPPVGEAFIRATHVELGVGRRHYKLYIPPAAVDSQALPLVVMLHGCMQNPDDFALGTGMNEAARQQGCYVLYPAQTQLANASGCWNWFKSNHQKRGRGEPAILAGMTQAIMSRYAIDSKRVYVAGLSAGGSMAAILGDAYPELFAAVGVHSGLATGAAHDLVSAFGAMQNGSAPNPRTQASPPTVVFQGDQDTTVHPSNGDYVVIASVASRVGLDNILAPELENVSNSIGRDYTRSVYKKADGVVIAEYWKVLGQGHAWSGGNIQGSYTDPEGPNATQEMLRFFLAHPKTNDSIA